MIKALDTRLAKVRSTSTELERVGAFYSRIIELCVRNPPKDNRHLRALEEQVRVACPSPASIAAPESAAVFRVRMSSIDNIGVSLSRIHTRRTPAPFSAESNGHVHRACRYPRGNKKKGFTTGTNMAPRCHTNASLLRVSASLPRCSCRSDRQPICPARSRTFSSKRTPSSVSE